MGTALKIVGALLLVLGLVGLLGGIAAAGYAFVDEKDHREQFFQDPERTDQNEAMIMGGAIAAGSGLVILIVGAVFLASGDGKVIIHNGPSGAAPAETPKGKTWVRALVALGIVGLLVVGVLWAAMAGPDSWAAIGASSTEEGPDGGRVLKTETLSGTVQGGAGGLAGSVSSPTSDSVKAFQAHAETERLNVTLKWTPSMTTTAPLRLVVEINGGGSWRELARKEGTSPVNLVVESQELRGASMRALVFASGVGLSPAQPFTLTVESVATG